MDLWEIPASFGVSISFDLSLSEQIEHLSTAAHLGLGLYKKDGKEFLPANLYTDIMLMIKNVVFCVAKAKVDNPERYFEQWWEMMQISIFYNSSLSWQALQKYQIL
ncbi:hypothetical protein BDQ17DRAFT_1435112 [Cyathus striatus]|nr:hypothetical protein BDQ17DRAFT_1435112 [Cyathus striatus]